eukprot:3314605-Prymnesium_polylepis.1
MAVSLLQLALTGIFAVSSLLQLTLTGIFAVSSEDTEDTTPVLYTLFSHTPDLKRPTQRRAPLIGTRTHAGGFAGHVEQTPGACTEDCHSQRDGVCRAYGA